MQQNVVHNSYTGEVFRAHALGLHEWSAFQNLETSPSMSAIIKVNRLLSRIMSVMSVSVIKVCIPPEEAAKAREIHNCL